MFNLLSQEEQKDYYKNYITKDIEEYLLFKKLSEEDQKELSEIQWGSNSFQIKEYLLFKRLPIEQQQELRTYRKTLFLSKIYKYMEFKEMLPEYQYILKEMDKYYLDHIKQFKDYLYIKDKDEFKTLTENKLYLVPDYLKYITFTKQQKDIVLKYDFCNVQYWNAIFQLPQNLQDEILQQENPLKYEKIMKQI